MDSWMSRPRSFSSIPKGTARRVDGLSEQLTHNFILGFTDTETVKLDFDDTPLDDVTYWAKRVNRWFRLRGFSILESSENNYHVVFNRPVTWSENVRIMAWVSLESNKKPLIRWFLMQCIKQGSTLRVSCKGSKPSPRVVSLYGKQDSQIKGFLNFFKLVKSISEKIPG